MLKWFTTSLNQNLHIYQFMRRGMPTQRASVDQPHEKTVYPAHFLPPSSSSSSSHQVAPLS